jgi:hypothetical protein
VPEDGERHELPQLLPGGAAVLFTILSVERPSRAAVYGFDGGETRDLFEGTGARYVHSGHLVFGRQGKLWATGFNPDSLQTRGAAHPVRDDVLWSAPDYPQFAVDGDLLAYVRASPVAMNQGKGAIELPFRSGPLASCGPTISVVARSHDCRRTASSPSPVRRGPRMGAGSFSRRG